LFKLRTDQLARLAHVISPGNEKTMDLSDPGTGKTPVAAVNHWRRMAESGMQTVWVQPKALMPKNVHEILRFTPFTEKDVAILDGTTAKVDKAMRSKPAVLLMGPDRFKRVASQLPAEYGALDVDEFHMCFGGAGGRMVNGWPAPSARVEAFYEHMKGVKQSVFMTGTIINGRLDTAFPAIHAIEPNYYPFGYEDFLRTHAYVDEYGKPFAWHDHQRLSQIFGRHAVRVTFEEIFGKQEVVFQTEWLAMNAKQLEIYKQFEDQAYLELENFMIDGTMPGTACIRARQIMEHPNYFPDLRDPHLPRVDIMPGERPAKLDALEIHFEDHKRLGTPVIVFAALVPAMEQIAELARSMGLRVAPIMNGDASPKQKKEADEGFRAGRYDVLVGSAPVCGIGFNWQFWGPQMQETDHVIFSSLSYQDSDFIQGYRRTVRQKRTKPLRVTTQAYFKSVDGRVMTIIERKSRDAHLVDPTRELVTFDSHSEEDA
jgi:hypothetical protein